MFNIIHVPILALRLILFSLCFLFSAALINRGRTSPENIGASNRHSAKISSTAAAGQTTLVVGQPTTSLQILQDPGFLASIMAVIQESLQDKIGDKQDCRRASSSPTTASFSASKRSRESPTGPQVSRSGSREPSTGQQLNVPPNRGPPWIAGGHLLFSHSSRKPSRDSREPSAVSRDSSQDRHGLPTAPTQ